jgi:hypothetical protein
MYVYGYGYVYGYVDGGGDGRRFRRLAACRSFVVGLEQP